jgi:acetyltransferase-like isoleucine patch superfamily enzyme
MSEQVRRGLRALVYAARWFRSQAKLAFYRSIYSGFSAGRGVSIGKGVYVSVTRGSRLRIEDGVRVDSYAHLISEGDLYIGARSYIGVGAIIVAAERVSIGADALIAAYVTIRDQDHRYDETAKAYNEQGLVASPVRIGDNVWIGTKATVLRGVQIGSNAIIGANAVVAGSIDAGTIAVGIPARPVKRLDR